MPGTDVEGARDRFEVFDALHHVMPICNPMTSAEVDDVLEALAPGDGESLIDIACGHGELVIRAAERARVEAVGIDLSPWAIVRSVDAASSRRLRGTIEWRLGDAHQLPRERRYDIVSCLGASWIWHGFAGTAAAMVARAHDGGRIAIGDLRLRSGSDAEQLSDAIGKVLTFDEQHQILDGLGIDVTDSFDAGSSGWDGYQDRILASVEAWSRDQPGERADEYVADQRRWREDHERDREFLDWTVWIGRLRR